MKHAFTLVAVPLVAAAAVAVAGIVLPTPGPRDWLFGIAALVAKFAAFAGCFVAARGFERGDYLHRAWLYVALGYLPLVLKDALPGGGPWLPAGGAGWGYARAALALAGNGVSVVGAWFFARASHVAGLEPPGSPTARKFWIVLGAIVAVALVAPGLRSDILDVKSSDARPLIFVAGDVGDVLSFVLIVPVLLTAIALRGGRLVWAWALLTAGNVGWLVYDGPAALAVIAGGMTPRLRDIAEASRTAACLYYATAGLAQRWALDGPAPGK